MLLFSIASFLEEAEFGIERHETKKPWCYFDRLFWRSMVIKVPGRILRSSDPEQFVELLHE